MDTTFGGFVRMRLSERGLSLRGFARELGRSPGNVCNILRGTDYLPPAKEVDRWAEVLGLDEDDALYLADLAAVAHVPAPLRERISSLIETDRIERKRATTARSALEAGSGSAAGEGG